jgi:hypothetical protein
MFQTNSEKIAIFEQAFWVFVLSVTQFAQWINQTDLSGVRNLWPRFGVYT